ncbi:MAG TPA: YggS family pyridoxal phosphate-dependent enzyme, partial [Chloroflexota bacterium]
MSSPGIAERLQRLRESIDESAQLAGRDDAVSLVAVTKTVDADRIKQAFDAGQRLFGENRVQEAAGKIEALRHELPGAEWHLIGHLQSNKAKSAVALFSLIESMDSQRIASELDARAAAAGVQLPVLLEVNVAGEGSKSGFSVDELERDMSSLLEFPQLLVAGLMTIAPLADDPEEVRWVFRRLRE